MLVYREWKEHKWILERLIKTERVWLCCGWYLFGILPLYVKRREVAGRKIVR